MIYTDLVFIGCNFGCYFRVISGDQIRGCASDSINQPICDLN